MSMISPIYNHRCQNGHSLGMSIGDVTRANKVVCSTCEIVVKDREGPAGVYQLKYRDFTEGYTPIPEEFIKNWLRSVIDVPGILQWFCTSLSIREAEAIAHEAENRHLPISEKAMVNLIEEMIPQLRNAKTEIGAETIERLRQAVFNIEKELDLPYKKINLKLKLFLKD